MEKEYHYKDIKEMFYLKKGSKFDNRISQHLRGFLDINGLEILGPLATGHSSRLYNNISCDKVKELILAQVCFEHYLKNSFNLYCNPILLNRENSLVKEFIECLGGEITIVRNFAVIKKYLRPGLNRYTYQIVKRVNLLDDAKETMTQDNKTVYNFNDQPKTKKEVKITKQETEKSIVDRLAKERSLERKNKELEERISQLEIKVDRVIELVSAVDDKTIIMAKMIRLLNEKDSEAQKLRA